MDLQGTDMELKLKSTQRIVDDKNQIVMAEGRMALLEHIIETGSINQAAKLMRMSYKSAWSKIRSSENHLGIKIVHSDKSRGTQLTEAGHKLLRQYKLMKQRSLTADDAIFESIFKKAGDSSASLGTPDKPTAPTDTNPPIVSIVGFSGSGKTTILEKLVSVLTADGVKVAIIKHDVHGFQMDKPGKDTWRHKQAGAVATIISSSAQVGMVMDVDHEHTPAELANFLGFADLVITEGYKHGPHPKLEVFRPEATGDIAPVCQNDPKLLALISDEKVAMDVPVFGTAQIVEVAAFLKNYLEFVPPEP